LHVFIDRDFRPQRRDLRPFRNLYAIQNELLSDLELSRELAALDDDELARRARERVICGVWNFLQDQIEERERA
jgi:hypothetical protein